MWVLETSQEFGLSSLLAALRIQGSYDLGRPLGDFILPQRSHGRLELGAQQHRILARRDRTASEDLDWTEFAQLWDGSVVYRSLYSLERHLVGEHEREVAFDRWKFCERLKAYRPQSNFV